MIDTACPECRAGLAQVAQFDLAFQCDDHGVQRVSFVLHAVHEAEVATLEATIATLRGVLGQIFNADDDQNLFIGGTFQRMQCRLCKIYEFPDSGSIQHAANCPVQIGRSLLEASGWMIYISSHGGSHSV